MLLVLSWALAAVPLVVGVVSSWHSELGSLFPVSWTLLAYSWLAQKSEGNRLLWGCRPAIKVRWQMFRTFQLLSQLVSSAPVAGNITDNVSKGGDCGQNYWWTLKSEFHVVFTDQETLFLVFPNYLETYSSSLASSCAKRQFTGSRVCTPR